MQSTILVLADDAPAAKPPGIFDSLPLILLPILFLFLIFLPARKDVAPPAGFPSADQLHIIPVDLKRAAQDDEALKKRFSDLFGG